VTTQRSFTRRGFLGSASVASMTGLAAGQAHAGPGLQGDPRRLYGDRSPFEKSARSFGASSVAVTTGSSRTPLQDLYGVITPSSLHFERHHSGVPIIDPAQYELLLHGLVERPLKFSMDELRRFPSVSRVHFIECAGNAIIRCPLKLDLVLTDMRMPGSRDGAGRVQVLRKEVPFLKVVMIASQQPDDEISKLLDGFLFKPVSRSQLASCVRTMLPALTGEGST
jgi:CheY-like chemotaxis protein